LVFFVVVVGRTTPPAGVIVTLAAKESRETADELELMGSGKYLFLSCRQAAGVAFVSPFPAAKMVLWPGDLPEGPPLPRRIRTSPGKLESS
jgi:hypothetical protein